MTKQKQPEALRLAGLLELAPEDGVEPQTTEDAAAELRRQHTRIAELQARIKTMAEEHADELMVAHLDGRMRAAQPAGAQQPDTAYAELPSYEHQRAIMEAERNASLDEYSRIVPLTSTESMIYERAFTNGWNRHASHGQAPAQAAPAAVAGPKPGERCQHCIDLRDGFYGSYAPPCPYHDDDGKPRVAAPTTQTAPVRGTPADLPPLPDPDLRDVGTKPEDIKNFLRGYATEYAKAALAACPTADSVTAPAAGAVAHTISDAQIEAMPVWRNFVGLWPESRREIVDAVVDLLAAGATAPAAQAADSVLEDAARLDWLLLHISGAEFRRIGVHYSGNARRADVDAARKQGANHD